MFKGTMAQAWGLLAGDRMRRVARLSDTQWRGNRQIDELLHGRFPYVRTLFFES